VLSHIAYASLLCTQIYVASHILNKQNSWPEIATVSPTVHMCIKVSTAGSGKTEEHNCSRIVRMMASYITERV